jgi:hypothetical protein
LIFSFYVNAKTVGISSYGFSLEQSSSDVFLLSNISDVKSRVLERVKTDVGLPDTKDVSVERIYNSSWYDVTLRDKQYIIDDSASYWIESGANDIYMFKNGANKVGVSNKDRESLMGMIQVINSSLNYFAFKAPIYSNIKRNVYVFIDLTCPHCRDFHLKEMHLWDSKGVQFVYVPFLRDVQDKKARQLAEYAFCADSNEEKMERIENIYILGVKRSLAKIPPASECSGLQKVLLDFSLMNGLRYALKGSPMFLSESGKVYYGTPSFKRNELY